MSRWVLFASLAFFAIVLYVLLSLAIVFGAPDYRIVLLAWLASPVLFFAYAYTYEQAPVAEGGRGQSFGEVFRSVFSPRRQAWSFLLGDIILLPGACVIAAHKWRSVMESVAGDLPPGWWFIVSFLLGVGAGATFHVMDKKAFASVDFAQSINAPTKLFHDLVSYPILFGALMFSVGPLLIRSFTPFVWSWDANWHVGAILVLVGIWLAFGLKDGARGLTPWGHPKYDLKEGVCIP